ncbi:YigZ family protein [bacterium]|nr:MAG: YigZ family protein [bacterium]
MEYTLAGIGESLLEVKKSRFLGFAYSASSEEECKRILKNLQKRFHDATHIVYCIRLGYGGKYEYFTDSGEPSGTAGAPIMRILKGQKISNAMVAVVRYFGGIKLGTGGLVKAYSQTARNAIEDAGIIPFIEMVEIEAKIPYGAVSQMAILIDKTGGTITSQDFSEIVTIKARIPKNAINELQSFISEITRGKEIFKIKD